MIQLGGFVTLLSDMAQMPPSWVVVGCAELFTSDWSKYQHVLEIVVQTLTFSAAPL